MHAARQLDRGVGEVLRVAKNIDRGATNGWQPDFQVRAGDELRVHTTGLREQDATQGALVNVQARGHAGQVPDRLDGHLGDLDVHILQDDFAIGFEAPSADGVVDLVQLQVRLGDGDGRADVIALVEQALEVVLRVQAPGIQRHDSGGVLPGGIRAELHGRKGIVQVGAVIGGILPAGDGEGPEDGVGAGVRADGVAGLGIGL